MLNLKAQEVIKIEQHKSVIFFSKTVEKIQLNIHPTSEIFTN